MRPYALLLLILAAWCALIIITPLLMPFFPSGGGILYAFFSLTCHQLPSRTLSIADVTLGLVKNPYKLPVCARDTAIYFALLLGVFLYPFVKSKDETEIPPLKWLIIAIMPIAVDGTTQLLGWRESTNGIRILTGALAGLVSAYYLIPLLNRFVILWQRKRRGKRK